MNGLRFVGHDQIGLVAKQKVHSGIDGCNYGKAPQEGIYGLHYSRLSVDTDFVVVNSHNFEEGNDHIQDSFSNQDHCHNIYCHS